MEAGIKEKAVKFNLTDGWDSLIQSVEPSGRPSPPRR
jgi:hypothetical protein